MSKDPIGLNGGLNNSAYVSDPNQWVDALGLNGVPTLPNSKIVQQSGVTIEHYYYGNDHLPAHAHVNGGGKTVKIGANGKPLKGEPALSSKQQQVVNENLSVIRRDINKINNYLKFQNYGCRTCKPENAQTKSTGTTLKAVGVMSLVQNVLHIFTIPQCKDNSLSGKCLCAMEAETLGLSYEQHCDPYGLEKIY